MCAHTDGLVREVVELLGVELGLRLLWRFQGLQIYVPKFEAWIRELRDRQMWSEFTGSNYRELSRRYGLSVRHVRHILNQDRFRQIGMFGGSGG